jgi:hypothetical protein
MTKLKNLRNNPLLMLNSTRSTSGLPEITEDMLFDRKKRINLYGGNVETNEKKSISRDELIKTIKEDLYEKNTDGTYKYSIEDIIEGFSDELSEDQKSQLRSIRRK